MAFRYVTTVKPLYKESEFQAESLLINRYFLYCDLHTCCNMLMDYDYPWILRLSMVIHNTRRIVILISWIF